MSFHRVAAVILLLIIAPLSGVFGVPDYENMNHKLDVHREQIDYINLCITNLGNEDTPEETRKLREEVENDFYDALKWEYNSRISFLQSNYNKSFEELQMSRKSLFNVYNKILLDYMEETEVLFRTISPLAIRDLDPDARYFLRTSYKKMAMAKDYHQRAYNMHPKFFPQQLKLFQEAIRYLRISRRYMILSLIQANLPRAEKPQYQMVKLNTATNGRSEEENSVNSFDKTRYFLVSLIKRKLLNPVIVLKINGGTRTMNILDMHRDNNTMMIEGRTPTRFLLLQKLESEEFQTNQLRPAFSDNTSDTKPANDNPNTTNTGDGNTTDPAAAGGN